MRRASKLALLVADASVTQSWAQLGPNVCSWPSRTASPESRRIAWHGEPENLEAVPPIWGSRGREFKSRQPDRFR
jgi:hypothetical protein